jgi:hypothetical protein
MFTAAPEKKDPDANSDAKLNLQKILAADPKKLSSFCQKYFNKDLKDNVNEDCYTEVKKKLTRIRYGRQLNAITVTAHMLSAINKFTQRFSQTPVDFNLSEARNRSEVIAQRLVFFVNLDADLTQLDQSAKKVLLQVQLLLDSNFESIPVAVFVLWHVLDEMEKQFAARYEAKANALVKLFSATEQPKLKKSLDDKLKEFRELFQYKKALEQIDDVGLYVYRLKQHVIKQNRALTFEPNWQAEEKGFPVITGYTDACQDYRDQFKTLILKYQMKQCLALETMQNLGAILQMEKTPEFADVFKKEVPQEILDLILTYLKKVIEAVTLPPSRYYALRQTEFANSISQMPGVQLPIDSNMFDDNNNIVCFIMLVKNEQVLKDTVWAAQSIALALKAKTQKEIKDIPPEEFSRALEVVPIMPHSEALAQERQTQYQLEQTLREEHKQKAAVANQSAFTEKLKKENEAKQQQEKFAIQEALLEKIKKLSSKKIRTLENFINPDVKAHKNFDEGALCKILMEIEFLEKTDKGYKIKNNFVVIDSTHRSHDGKLDGNFCRGIRDVLANYGVTMSALEAIRNTQKHRV